jgi:hypothetical protein
MHELGRLNMIYKIYNILIIKNVKGQMSELRNFKVGENYVGIAGLKYLSTIEKGKQTSSLQAAGFR